MGARRTSTKYRDYYFLPQFEAGQQELVELHHYTYEVDLHAMTPRGHDKRMSERVRPINAVLLANPDPDPNPSPNPNQVRAINAVLLEQCLFSTQRQADYHKMM